MRDMDIAQEAAVNEVSCADDVGSGRLVLVVLAPVDVGRSASPGRVDNMARLDFVEFPRPTALVHDIQAGESPVKSKGGIPEDGFPILNTDLRDRVVVSVFLNGFLD